MVNRVRLALWFYAFVLLKVCLVDLWLRQQSWQLNIPTIVKKGLQENLVEWFALGVVVNKSCPSVRCRWHLIHIGNGRRKPLPPADSLSVCMAISWEGMYTELPEECRHAWVIVKDSICGTLCYPSSDDLSLYSEHLWAHISDAFAQPTCSPLCRILLLSRSVVERPRIVTAKLIQDSSLHACLDGCVFLARSC